MKKSEKFRFFYFSGPELIVSTRIQGGIISTMSSRVPPFQQKNKQVPQGAPAWDFLFLVLFIKSNFLYGKSYHAFIPDFA
jgi:hypothetical protein